MSGETVEGLMALVRELVDVQVAQAKGRPHASIIGAWSAVTDYATRLASPAGEVTALQALRDLTDSISSKHYGRKPEQVQIAYDNALAILAAQGGGKP